MTIYISASNNTNLYQRNDGSHRNDYMELIFFLARLRHWQETDFDLHTDSILSKLDRQDTKESVS